MEILNLLLMAPAGGTNTSANGTSAISTIIMFIMLCGVFVIPLSWVIPMIIKKTRNKTQAKGCPIKEEQTMDINLESQIILPGALSAFILGLISLSTIWLVFLYVFPGLILLCLAIIAFIKGKRADKLYFENPQIYIKGYKSFAKTAKVLGKTAIIISSIFIVLVSYSLLTAPSKEELLKNKMRCDSIYEIQKRQIIIDSLEAEKKTLDLKRDTIFN
jgi:hypothetical protein